jgi:hypothetical protein
MFDVVEVKALKKHHLFLRFENGISGIVDIADIIPFEGIFAPLKDSRYFSKVKINSDIGTICWENGADISPCYLYSQIKAHSHAS